MKPVMGIGWDVGGWQGDGHGWAACRWAPGEELDWFDGPITRAIEDGGLFDLQAILDELLGSRLSDLRDHRVVVAVDAPLGFPSGFRRLLMEEASCFSRPSAKMNSRLAYRHTDRHVHISTGQSPLSPSFDTLTSVATAAMVHARRWRAEHGFSVPSFTKVSDPDRVVIEVYPALVKQTSEEKAALKRFAGLMPEGVAPGTDAYDAAICALHAIKFGTGEAMEDLPPLIPPDLDCNEVAEEGWIYYFAPRHLGRRGRA